jgi:hypothetical protein
MPYSVHRAFTRLVTSPEWTYFVLLCDVDRLVLVLENCSIPLETRMSWKLRKWMEAMECLAQYISPVISLSLSLSLSPFLSGFQGLHLSPYSLQAMQNRPTSRIRKTKKTFLFSSVRTRIYISFILRITGFWSLSIVCYSEHYSCIPSSEPCRFYHLRIVYRQKHRVTKGVVCLWE